MTGEHLPIIIGHEFSGTVTEVHPSVSSSLSAGDKVAVEGLLTDDTCYACRIHKRNICDKSAFLGLSGGAGGLCESIVIPASTCHLLPEGISLELGALVEPLSVAWHAVSNSGVQENQSALVLGAGPIGLATILCLKAKGVTKILASEPSTARNTQARKMGCLEVFDPRNEDVVGRAKACCEEWVPRVLLSCRCNSQGRAHVDSPAGLARISRMIAPESRLH
jgi:(R,R)-butanediol dehydrogenase/meso-butanediol dehydrogenase/diacetyl reductase